MQPKRDPNRRRSMLLCAQLRAEGKTQLEIGTRLNLKQPTVSRLLQEAQDESLLTPPRQQFLKERLTAEELRELKDLLGVVPDTAKKIRDRFSTVSNFDVHILPASNRDKFAVAAAPTVVSLLSRCPTIGVSMGRTLSALIEAIYSEIKYVRTQSTESVVCVPVSGDCVYLLNQHSQTFSASYLAGRLEEVLTGSKSAELPTLVGVPAYVPSRLSIAEDKLAVVKEFVQSIPGYQRIFGPKKKKTPALADNLAALLTGVGIVVPQEEEAGEVSTGACIRERLLQEKIDKDELNELIMGEISGILIPRERLTRPQRKRVEELNLGWLGITEQQLKKVAQRQPGVVVVASGSRKADLIARIVQESLVSNLIVDSELAVALAST
jgi:Transcriptional regulator, contains sigma factor-related N-terminal domain